MKKLLLVSAVSAALAPGLANADVRINGFANFTVGFTTSEQESDLFGYDDKLDFSNGSLFAIQVSGDVNDKVTATAQLVARGENDYEADFEWAYMTYTVNDNFAVNAGRLRLPLFRYSASSDVGYSFHWAEVPYSVYDVPFTNLDGVRFDYTNYAGDWDYNLQLALGTYENTIGDGEIYSDDVVLFTAETSNEGFKARAVLGRGKTSFDADVTDAAFDQLALISPALADRMRLSQDTGFFYGIGFEYDNFDWFISSEITLTGTSESFSADDQAYYVTVGKRFGKFTPSITHEARDGIDDIKYLDDVAALPAQFQPAAAGVVFGFQQAFFEDYAMTTLGLRYDLDTQVALKADLSRYDDKINDDTDATLVRLSVNYVF